MTGTGLGGHGLGTADLIKKGPRDGRVRFVAAGRRDPFIFVINVGGGSEGFFQAGGTDEWGRAPQFIYFTHFVRDGNISLGTDFLLNQLHGKQNGKKIGSGGFFGKWVQNRVRRHRVIGGNVVPELWNIIFAK